MPAYNASERPVPEGDDERDVDPEAPGADAADQRHVDDGQSQEWPTTPPPPEASEADAAEQQQEVPVDDEDRD